MSTFYQQFSSIEEKIAAIKKLLSHHSEIKKEPLSLDDAYLFYTLGFHLYENGELERALTCFRRLIIDYPYEVRFLKAVASTYQMMKNYDEAVFFWSYALTIDPSDAHFALQAAVCFLHLEKMDFAREALEYAKNRATDKETLSKISLFENKMSVGK